MHLQRALMAGQDTGAMLVARIETTRIVFRIKSAILVRIGRVDLLPPDRSL